NRLAGLKTGLVQRMKRRRRRAHHDRTHFERNLVRKCERVLCGNFDELGVAAVAMSADHLHTCAELLQPARAKLAAFVASVPIRSTRPATSWPRVSGRLSNLERPAR